MLKKQRFSQNLFLVLFFDNRLSLLRFLKTQLSTEFNFALMGQTEYLCIHDMCMQRPFEFTRSSQNKFCEKTAYSIFVAMKAVFCFHSVFYVLIIKKFVF